MKVIVRTKESSNAVNQGSNGETDRVLHDIYGENQENESPAGLYLSHVTGEGRAQLDVRLNRDQSVPLVSVLSGLLQSLQEDMLDLSHHVTAVRQVMVGRAF